MVFMIIPLLLEPVSMYCSFTSASVRFKCVARLVTSAAVTLIMSERQQLPQLVQSICGVMTASSSCTSLSMPADSCERRNALNAWFSNSFSCAACAITSGCVIIFKPASYVNYTTNPFCSDKYQNAIFLNISISAGSTGTSISFA